MMTLSTTMMELMAGTTPATLLTLCLALGLALLFKPLLVGVGRALLLVVRPRLTREEREARRHMRDAAMLRRMINASQGPSDAAELQAMAARA